MGLLATAGSIWGSLTTRHPRPEPPRYRIRKVNLEEGVGYTAEAKDNPHSDIWWIIKINGATGISHDWLRPDDHPSYVCADEAEAGHRVNLHAHLNSEEVIWYG